MVGPGSLLVLAVVLVVVAAVVAAIVTAVLVGRNRRRNPTTPTTSAPPRDPFADVGDIQGDPGALKAGDMLEFGTERTWIRGTLRLSEGGVSWAEHFLEVDEGKRWLSVEYDPDLRMVLWSGRPELDLTPHDSTLELDGVRYQLTERGSAAYRSEGTTGLRAEGGMDYADYDGDGGVHLAFERFDHGRWEPSTGATVTRGDFTIYPASGQ